MTTPRGRIPVALRVAAWLLPRDAREEVLGDLVEAWRARRDTQSRWACALWTLRQPIEALRARLVLGQRGGGAPAPPPGLIRRSRGFGFSWLDVKLGVRMLGKQPVLTVVAGLTLALGIPAALAPTHAIRLFYTDLPVEEGDRVFGGYIIEVAENPTAFLSTLRAVAADVDPEAIVQSAQTMTDLIALNLLELRSASILVFVLSLVGMILAATGLYALMSFTVSQRTREIGIRTALGASARNVVMTTRGGLSSNCSSVWRSDPHSAGGSWRLC